MPSLRQLEYLLALQEKRHFRRAAEACGVSQPTLSAQLRSLEDRLGVQLVERSRTTVIMTPVGQQIAAVGRRMISDAEEIRQLAAGHGQGIGGLIRVGLAPTIGPYLLPKMVHDLHAAYPSLKLYVREDIPSALPAALEQGRHDILVIPQMRERLELETRLLFREPLYLVMPASHPLSNRKRLDRSALRGQSVLTLESGHQLNEQVERICLEVGAELLSDYEGTSLDTLAEMIGMGMGLSFLPGLYVRSNLIQNPAITIAELSGAPIYRTIMLVWRRSSARSADFEILGDHFRDTVRREFPEFTVIG
jgi:LysR family hydrogen peroxide-inducible transcriptional activator